MRKDKVRAFTLRREGRSYSQISRALEIPKSTLAVWFKNLDWSQEIKAKLGKEHSFNFDKKLKAIIKSNKTRWAKTHQIYRERGTEEFEALKDDSLFLAGVMLYWGEGEKTLKQSRIKLANSDPMMIRVFYRFLKETLKVPEDKIKVWLLLYPDLIDNTQKTFWSKATGIPLSHFKGSIYIKGRSPNRRFSYGVCNISVQSRELKEKIMTWLDLWQRRLIS